VRILAKEALEMGNLLGLKVVDNEEKAMKRLTTSLKKRTKHKSSE